MPCDTGGWGNNWAATDHDREEWTHNSPVAEAFCELCTFLESTGNLPCESSIPKAYKWWLEHKERDRKKIEEEKKRQEIESDRRTALSKLTWHEKKLLGIKE